MVKMQAAKQQAVQTGLPVFVSMQVTKSTTVSLAQMAIAYQEAHKVDRVVSITSKYKPRAHPKNPHIKLTHMQNFDHLKKGQMYRFSIHDGRGFGCGDYEEDGHGYATVFESPSFARNATYTGLRVKGLVDVYSGNTAIFLEQTDEHIKVLVGDVVGWIKKEQRIRLKRYTARMLRRAEAQEGPQIFPDE